MAQIIDVPGLGEVEFPDDMSDADISAAIRRSLEASGGKVSEQAPAVPPSGYTGALGASVLAGGQAMTFGFGDEIGAAAFAPLEMAIGAYSGEDSGKSLQERLRDGYARGLRSRRELMEYAREKHPVASTVGAVGGGLAMASRLPSLVPRGAGLPTTAFLGGVEGGGYGALAAAGENDGSVTDRARAALGGVATGAVVGSAAPAVLAGGGAALRYVDQAIRANIGTPSNQAATRILSAARSAGLDDAAVAQRMRDLGQEGMVVDVLGTRGEALARSTANISPEAQGMLEGASHARMAGQNDRVVGALEAASGLPAGSRSTVDDLKAAAYEKRAPAINEAYGEARKAGFDIPIEPFEDILQSPMGQVEFRKAINAAKNRYATGDNGAGSRLGVLDQLKRGFDARARVADRAGDNNVADQARRLAAVTRQKLDEALEGGGPADFVLDGSGSQMATSNPYGRARKLRQEAYRTDEAFDLGAELASGRVPLDGPTRARAAAEANPGAVAQGYAAAQAQNLLNRRGTPGAIDGFGSRMAQESMDAALGPAAGGVRRQLAAEQQFGRTHRALTGNSSTARQLAQMGLTAGAGAGLGLYAGLDPTTAGVTGIAAALARKGGGAALTALRANNEAAVAPYMARFLTEQGLPATREGARLVMRTPWMRQLLGRTLAGIEGGESSRTR